MNWKLIRLIDTYIGIPLLYAVQCIRVCVPFRARARRDTVARRILLVKFWGIGNLFMMLPAASALKAAHPHAEIELLTLGTNREAARATGAFAAVHTIETSGIGRFVVTSLRQVRVLRRRNYDRIVDFEQFAKYSALFCATLGRNRTVGFRTQGQHRHFLYARSVDYDNTVHITRSYQRLAGAADARQDAPLPDPERPYAAALPAGLPKGMHILRERMLVLMHPGTSGNFEERRWPGSHYAALADLLIEHHDAAILLTGLREESPLADAVRGAVRRKDRVTDLSGRLSFPEFLALVRTSDLVVSSDTAPVHLASAAGIPVVGLYGPNTPLLYGPWGGNGLACYRKLACSPCITNFNAKTHVCRHPDGKGTCMRNILPEEVYRSIKARYLDRDAELRLGKLSVLDPCTV